MAKSLVINCTTGKAEIVDTPDEIKPIEIEPFDTIKDVRTKASKASSLTIDGLVGMDIKKMSNKEMTLLLSCVCQILGLADENNIIR